MASGALNGLTVVEYSQGIMGATCAKALADLGPDGASYSDWKKASGLPDSTFKDTRGRLVTDGWVIKTEYGRYMVAELGPGAETGPEQGCPAAA